MKITLVLLVMVLVTAYGQNQNVCECSELILQTECQFAGCQWETNSQTLVSQCINKFPINIITCSDYDDQLTCDFLQGCAWTQDEKCAPFTQCSDYMIDSKDNADQCYLKDQSCIQGQLNTNGYIKCSTIEDACKDETQKDKKQFSLKSQRFSKGSGLTKSGEFRLSNFQNCISQKYTYPSCSSISNPILCTFFKKYHNTYFCEWSENQCVEMSSPSGLNSKNCYLNTGGTYSWNQDSCQICKEKKQNSSENKANFRLQNEISSQDITASQTTTETDTSIYSFNLTQLSGNIWQKLCNRTYSSTELIDCDSSKCLSSSQSSESLQCHTAIDSNSHIKFSNTINCQSSGQSINLFKSFTQYSTTYQESCSEDQSQTTFQNNQVFITITQQSKSTYECTSNSTVNSSSNKNSVQKCNAKQSTGQTISNQTIDTIHQIETKCNQTYSKIVSAYDSDSTQTTFVTNNFCESITDNDNTTQTKTSEYEKQVNIPEKIQYESTTSEVVDAKNIVISCTGVGQFQSQVLEYTSRNESNKTTSDLQYILDQDAHIKCDNITNSDSSSNLPHTFVQNNTNTFEIKNYNYYSYSVNKSDYPIYNNNCSNGSTCIITTTDKSSSKIEALLVLIILFLICQ